jgi:hypothetical protein
VRNSWENDDFGNGAPTLAGDPTDDDGQVLDSLVEPSAEPPTPSELPGSPKVELSEPKSLTRLLTGSQKLLASWDAVLLLPADPLRLSLQMWAASDTATDYARFSDDAGKIQVKSSSALLWSGQLLQLPLSHTGPVWVSCPDATGPVTVCFATVTR